MESFTDLTTFKVGGSVGSVVRTESPEVFMKVLADLAARHEPFLIIGGGSNVLPADEPYDGTVVIPTFGERTWSEAGDALMLRAEAGASWDQVVAEAVARGAWGIENLSAIPGTVGGAAVANIGAYGAALSDVVHSVEVYDIERGAARAVSVAECQFGYRASLFKSNPGHYGIIAVTLALSRAPRPNLSYRDLAAAFPNGDASLAAIREKVIAIRAKKFPPLSECGTAGSFFLNPIVAADDVERLEKEYPGIPTFVLPEGGVKVPLAWILDHVVHAKGMREGNAYVWDAQPLVIATDRGATARDVRTLAENIAREVKKQTGITITPEVRVL